MASSNPSPHSPIVLCGPSGAGKSTLIKKLFAEFPGEYGFSVSHTTRAPRAGEVPGESYHFVTRDEFEHLVQQGAFLEHAEFGGNRYGTTAKAVADVSSAPSSLPPVASASSPLCRRALLDIDTQGVKTIKQRHPQLGAYFIFIAPPSFARLRERLEARHTETPQSLERRLAMAASEMAYARTGAHDIVIINDDLDRAYALLKAAVRLPSDADNATSEKFRAIIRRGGDPLPPPEQHEEQWAQSVAAADEAATCTNGK